MGPDGAPAGAYLVNKMAVRANPVITDVSVADGLLTVSGGGFGPGPAGAPAQVSVNGAAAPAFLDPATGTLSAPLPQGTAAPFEVTVTARGLRSDPYRYESPAKPAVPAQQPPAG